MSSPTAMATALHGTPADMPSMIARAPSVPVSAAPPLGLGVTCIPGEDVLLLAVNLPAMSAAQRRAAIGFAIEDHLAQPLDEVHVALGPRMASGLWLVGVVSHEVLAGITVPQGHRLVPDVLIVPAPAAGWAVLGQEGRVLVRLPDGTGFAAHSGAVAQLWQIAGMPRILSYGGPLPERMVVAETAGLPETPDELLARFDLTDGARTVQGLRLSRGLRLPLAILAAFVIGHMLIAVGDLVALNRIEADRADQLRAVLAASGISAGNDLSDAVSRALVAAEPTDQGTFLDLSARVFGAISDQAGQVSLRDLRYMAAPEVIVMTVEAASLEALQGIEDSLLAAGLFVQTGAATTSDSRAEVQMTVGRTAP